MNIPKPHHVSWWNEYEIIANIDSPCYWLVLKTSYAIYNAGDEKRAATGRRYTKSYQLYKHICMQLSSRIVKKYNNSNLKLERLLSETEKYATVCLDGLYYSEVLQIFRIKGATWSACEITSKTLLHLLTACLACILADQQRHDAVFIAVYYNLL